jgi:transposase InsO family protein
MVMEQESLRRWEKRRMRLCRKTRKPRGRPESVPVKTRWLIRQCYKEHLKQWGPAVLQHWAHREGHGCWSVATIARIIADLKPKREPKKAARRYEVAATNVMWSEDGTSFREKSRKRELLVVQDEKSRLKLNWHLAQGAGGAKDVVHYLREAFESNGAPLVLKHDGGAAFHDQAVQNLLDEYGVVSLTSPPGYPQFNGKKERSMRDIKGYVFAQSNAGIGVDLEARIAVTMADLNEDRPRPVLNGQTAREAYEANKRTLPNRQRFKLEVQTKQAELEAAAGSRTEIHAARRTAVIAVLSRYGLIDWRADMSTNSGTHARTN